MMHIYIPTRGRVGAQHTHADLHEALGWTTANRITLVTDPFEADLLERHVEGARVLECEAEGIANTRQFIMDWHRDHHPDEPKLFMVDDDLKFATRRLDNPAKFIPAEPEELDLAFTRMYKMLDQVAVVGMCNRSGGNRQPVPVQNNGRIHDLMGLNLDMVDTFEGRINRLPLMEDFDITLQALTAGFPVALLSTHCKDDRGGSNAPGGCSEYRTLSAQADAAHALAEQWPGLVRTVRKKAVWKGDMAGEQRTDVVVQWAKAREWGLNHGSFPTNDPDWSTLAPEWNSPTTALEKELF